MLRDRLLGAVVAALRLICRHTQKGSLAYQCAGELQAPLNRRRYRDRRPARCACMHSLHRDETTDGGW